MAFASKTITQASRCADRRLPSHPPCFAVAIYTSTEDGYYCYDWYETLWVTVGNNIPKPGSTGGDIKNTKVFSKTLDMSGDGWYIKLSKAYTGRYVAIQVRCAACFLTVHALPHAAPSDKDFSCPRDLRSLVGAPQMFLKAAQWDMQDHESTRADMVVAFVACRGSNKWVDMVEVRVNSPPPAKSLHAKNIHRRAFKLTQADLPADRSSSTSDVPPPANRASRPRSLRRLL